MQDHIIILYYSTYHIVCIILYDVSTSWYVPYVEEGSFSNLALFVYSPEGVRFSSKKVALDSLNSSDEHGNNMSSSNLLQEESNAIFLQEKYAEVAVNRRKFEYD